MNHYCQFFRSHPDRKPARQGTTGLEAGTLPRSVPNEAFSTFLLCFVNVSGPNFAKIETDDYSSYAFNFGSM